MFSLEEADKIEYTVHTILLKEEGKTKLTMEIHPWNEQINYVVETPGLSSKWSFKYVKNALNYFEENKSLNYLQTDDRDDYFALLDKKEFRFALISDPTKWCLAVNKTDAMSRLGITDRKLVGAQDYKGNFLKG
jgi:hypothetical protein